MNHALAMGEANQDSFFAPAELQHGFHKEAIVPVSGTASDMFAHRDRFLKGERFLSLARQPHRESYPPAREFFDACTINSATAGAGIRLGSNG